MRKLAPFDSVVLLSGDVHYGFSNHAAVANGDQRACIVQLCVSPAYNEAWMTRSLAGSEAALPALSGILEGGTDIVQALLVELDKRSMAATGATPVEHWRRLQQARLWLSQDWEAGRVPRLPLELWTQHDGLAEAAALIDQLVTTAPNPPLRFVVRFVQAAANGVRPITLDRAAPLPAPRPGAGSPDQDSDGQAGDLIGINNLGQVEFQASAGGDPDSVLHTLYWLMPTTRGVAERLWLSEHRLPLTAPDAGKL